MTEHKSIKINGKKLAKQILDDLKPQVAKLKKNKIVPHLAIVLIGNNKESLSFIAQKKKAAKRIKVKTTLHHFPKTPSYQVLAEKILKTSQDTDVHGVIIQQPLPPTLSAIAINKRVNVKKDVDGFRQKTYFHPPVANAILKVINEIYFTYKLCAKKPKTDIDPKLLKWLKNQKIVVIGRGETGGKPIAKLLRANRVRFIMAHSQTENVSEYTKKADIIITAVGKQNVVTENMIKQNCILIGVGVKKTKKDLYGDYNESKIKQKASYYTPTPGGVGPVNVACLMQNVVNACLLQHGLH